MTTSNLAALYSLVIFSAFVVCLAIIAPSFALASEARPQANQTTAVNGPASTRVAQAGNAGPETFVARTRAEPRPRHLVIFFHGIRGRGSVMQAIGDSWKRSLPDTKFVAPDAPFPHRSGGRQWFAVDDQAMRPERIQAARAAFDRTVSDTVEREGFADALDRVTFVGVSQGAIMALDAVASGRWKVGSLVTFAGLLPLPPTSPSTDTRILLMHGEADRTIPSAVSVAARGQLQAAGYDVTLRTYPDVGHTISSEEARDASAFLREQLD